jgi:WD40 repeat protein
MSNDSTRDRRLEEILHAYLQSEDSGQAPSRNVLLREHPEFATELAAFFADQDELARITRDITPPPLAAADDAEAATIAPGESSAHLPGEMIRYFGDYELLNELARGGMGVVYRARQVSLNRFVALKMILAGQFASPDDVRRFHTEAEAAANLDHPNIVPIYEVGEYQGQHYFSMKLIDGRSLAAAGGTALTEASSERAALKATATLIATIARAVHHAHQRGIIHRDLKPGNILLDANGEPHVTDFGLAKRVEGDSKLTRSGAIVGTPSYMAPEQARGERGLSVAADVYSLGAILYEMLTGRPPFQADTPLDTVLQVLEQEPKQPRSIDPRIERDLETICLKCLEKNPYSRYPSAEALAVDLQRWLSGEPIQARPTSKAERMMKWVRRRPALAALLVVIVVALAALVGGGARFTFLLDAALRAEAKARRDAVDEAEAANTARELAEAREKESRRLLYIAQIRLVPQEYEANSLGRVRELLKTSSTVSPGMDDQRGFEWYYWSQLVNRELLTIKGHTDSVTSVVFSPDGRRIVSGGWDNLVKVWDANTGSEMRTLERHMDWVLSVAISADGRSIASASQDNNVTLWSFDGKKNLTLRGHTGGVRSLAFSPDCRQIATGSYDNSVKVWNAGTGEELLTFRRHVSMVECVAFSPDSTRIASGSRDGTLKMWDAATGREVFKFRGHDDPLTCIAFSPDGRWIASGSADKTVKIWETSGGQEKLTLNGHRAAILSVAFSPDGLRIATGSEDSSCGIWDAMTGKEILTLDGHAGWVTSVAFSPDGRRIASGSRDRTVKLWNATSGEDSLKGHAGEVTSIAFSPDSSRIVSGSADSTVKVWDSIGLCEILTLKGHTTPVVSVAISQDGHRIASADTDGIIVWDAVSGQQMKWIPGRRFNWPSSCGLAFSPDGQRIVSGDSSRGLTIYDVVNGNELLTLPLGRVGGVAFSPDGSLIACGGDDGKVVILEASSGRVIHELEGHIGSVASVSFSPDGQRIATAGTDGTVRIWDSSSAREIVVCNGHRAKIQSITYSPNGQRIASGSNDHTVKLWNTESGQELLTLKGKTKAVANSVAFSPDGRRVALGSTDGTVRIWESSVTVDELQQRQIVFLVHELYARLALRSDVLAELLKDTRFDSDSREYALKVAQSRSENAGQLNDDAWRVVREPGDTRENYALALRKISEAASLVPKSHDYLYTLGVAQYRVGRYEDALNTLKVSDEANTARDRPHPGDKAFIAMAQTQLGRKVDAKKILDQLRVLMRQPFWAEDAEAQGFLREAAELIEGKPSQQK